MKRNWSEGQIQWLHDNNGKPLLKKCTRCPGLRPLTLPMFLVHARSKHRHEWANYWETRPTELSIPDEILDQEEVLQ